MKIRLILLTAAAVVSVCAMPTLFVPAAFAQTEKPAPAAMATQREGAKLRALFAADDEASLKRNPVNALFRGDMRYADQLGDGVSDAYYDGERKAAQTNITALTKIDRSGLDETDQIAYDVFELNQRDVLKNLSSEYLELTKVRPLNHFFGIHTFYPTFASGKGAAPFKTRLDYDNNLKRHKQFVANFDAMRVRFQEGKASGVVETKLTIANVIDQLNTQLAQKTIETPYYAPVLNFPKGITAADQKRLKLEYAGIIEQGIKPAYARMRDYLRDEYLLAARDQVGLSSMRNGTKLYDYLIEQTTTLPLKADEIHNLGLSEVRRISGEMEGIRKETGFMGGLGSFFEYMRSDAKFKPASRAALTQGYYGIGKTVDAQIKSQFKYLPKSQLEIRPYEEFREKYEAGGSYESGTPDGKRPGIFYFNAYDLPSRTTPGMTTLYLHEGAPGHHFQISIAQENTALPAFMRFGGNTAYVEGWALYSETLGYEMGLYKDPYQRFGTLSDEMLRAMRLVVDTGLHSKGWTRDQAIKYMMDNSDMGKTDATAEVERYIAIPTQALAYKIGSLTIQRLKTKAKAELGAKFDVRAFHNQILGTGALPLAILEKKIDRWIATSK